MHEPRIRPPTPGDRLAEPTRLPHAACASLAARALRRRDARRGHVPAGGVQCQGKPHAPVRTGKALT